MGNWSLDSSFEYTEDDIQEAKNEGIEKFAEWLCNKYEVFEKEDDEYTLYGDMKYNSKEELLNEFKAEIGIQ